MMICNPKNTAIGFCLKSFAEAGSCFFVICNRIEKLILGLGDKDDVHGARRFSASSMTSWYEIPVTAPLSTALILS